MESSDVFERTEEWARTIRDALDAPRLQAEASADEPEQTPGLVPDDQVHTPSRSHIQPPTPADTPVLTPSRTRIVLKADSVAESAGTAETIPTLATLESTFEATLHARAMRAAGADLDAPTTPVKAVKAPRATFALYGGNYDDYDDESRRRRITTRRDSMKLREALVRGQEGTRQRRRWENDHLMHVPNAQLPLPSDWQVHPTHPVHHNLPYHVAQYWDRGLCKYVNETRAAAAVLRRNQIIAQQAGISVDKAFPDQKAKSKAKGKPRMPRGPGSVISMATSEAGSEFSTFHVPASTVGLVTRQLRAAAKRTPAVKLWVRAIEVPIRQYVVSESMRLSDQSDLGGSVDGQSDNGVAINAGDDEEFAVESDSEDEVVFVGRRILQQKTESWKRCPTVSGAGKAAPAEVSAGATDDDDAASDTTIAPTAEGILFDDLGEGERGSFKRWLAHSLSDYYGLTSTSSTIDSPGKPGNRVVYMALREEATQPDAGPILIPRPMWELFDL